MSEIKTPDIKYNVFGSENSLDLDVMVFIDAPLKQFDSAQECLQFKKLLANQIKTDKDINVNLAVLKDGVITWAYKGTADECNNSIFETFKLHKENSIQYITRKVERNLPAKLIRALRIILTMITRTDKREEVKKALKTNTVIARLTTLRAIKFEELKFTTDEKDGGSSSFLSEEQQENFKTIAFQLGQTMALTMNIELYTKTGVGSVYPCLQPFLKRTRHNESDLKLLTYVLGELLAFVDAYIKKTPEFANQKEQL